VDIVTDYLSALKCYTVQTLERRLGREAVHDTKVEYVLTVPAVWSDKARQMTMEAAVRAGLGVGGERLLRLITEPEGAAEYALRSIQPNSMKVRSFCGLGDIVGMLVRAKAYL
jgi:molecular chaperone DnaK (HSP70)